VKIVDGSLMLYFCFDVADEINIHILEKILGTQAEKAFLSRTTLVPEYLQYKSPPLLIKFGEEKLPGGLVSFAEAKIYEFGVVTIRFTSQIQGEMENLIGLNRFIQENNDIKNIAVKYLREIIYAIKPSLIRPGTNPESDWEDYAIYWVHSFDEKVDSQLLLKNYGSCIARIMRAEEQLSDSEIEDACKYHLSYYGDDLTLIDWSSAFLYDPRKTYEVIDVIEFAVIQLLELRLYDSVLDRSIESAYDDLAAIRQKRIKVVMISSVLDRLSRMKLDISEVIDRLENYLKLIGDLYLAKVYQAASSRFYLDRWKLAVREKLSVIESLYTKEWERLQTSRMVIAEIAIVVLFVIDIILIFFEIIKTK